MTQENLSSLEKYQEESFNKKAGKEKFFHVGGRANRNHKIKFAKLISELQLKEKDDVLEIGTGEGEQAEWLLQATDVFYTGIDISQKSLDVAAEKLYQFEGRFHLQRDNANNLSFESNKFGAVFCSATLHHMENPFLMISEMARVTKSKGKVALMEPNWIYPSNIAFRLFLKEDRNMWIMRRKNFQKWMEDAGLTNILIEHLIYTPPVPKALIPVYNQIDRIFSKIPLVKRCSLMLFGVGEKT